VWVTVTAFDVPVPNVTRYDTVTVGARSNEPTPPTTGTVIEDVTQAPPGTMYCNPTAPETLGETAIVK